MSGFGVMPNVFCILPGLVLCFPCNTQQLACARYQLFPAVVARPQNKAGVPNQALRLNVAHRPDVMIRFVYHHVLCTAAWCKQPSSTPGAPEYMQDRFLPLSTVRHCCEIEHVLGIDLKRIIL